MKTAVITGATSGIGRETLNLFLARGWSVVALVRGSENVNELNKINRVISYEIDLANSDLINRLAENIFQQHGSIDLLINNAGTYLTKPIEVISDDELDNMFNSNYLGVINMVRAFIPYFRKQGYGTILNVSSLAGRTTFPYQSLYHSTKWAIEGFTEGLCYELEPLGIRLKIVEPGMVKTRLYRNCKESYIKKLPDNYKESYTKWFNFLMMSYENGYSPSLDAITIYRAATDKKRRLRYRSDFNTKFLLFIRSITSDNLFKKIVKSICKL